MMKRIIPISILKILVVICLFVLGKAFSQDKKQTETMLFGKQITPENVNPKNGIIRCGTTEYEKMLQEKNPKRMTQDQFESWLAPLVQKNAAMRTAQTNAVITIPVVVHVIYNGQAVGIAPNISDAQVQSQITVLNQDFGRTGPGFNTNPVGVDTQIRFVLAQQDPYGKVTNGIDRVSFVKESWSTTDIESILKPATIWDPTQYLNLWTVQFTDSTYLGYAQFPDTSSLNIAGPSGNGIEKTDGVVIRYNAFGSGSGSSFLLKEAYNKGRTTTHEIGHWLGLIHIWGDDKVCTGNNSTSGDYVSDTPDSNTANYDCLPVAHCIGNDMTENYMDYTNDDCMNTFTAGQKARMDAVMTNSPRRKSLKTSTKGNTVLLFANDAEVKFESSSAPISCGANVNQTIQKIIIYNRGTTNLTLVTGGYTINGGNTIPFSWTGNLATNEFAAFPITINSTIKVTIVVQVDKANGVTDERVTNNKATGSFTLPSAPTKYPFTNYIFRLQQDYYGSETTWELKNNTTGEILYSGGPYSDTYVNSSTVSPIPALITQKWVLGNNQCYTFTINDSGKDGICCGTGLGDSGTGYYDIKTADGSTVIASGASFTTSESKSFITDSFLKTFYDKDEYVNEECKFVIPDYKDNGCDDAHKCDKITQYPDPGDIISGVGTITRITLEAYDSNNIKLESKTFDITLKEKDTFLFPNPAKETIKISTSCALSNSSYTIANSLGQIVLQKEVSAASDLNIDTSTLSTGIYFITVTKENEKKTLRFVKD